MTTPEMQATFKRWFDASPIYSGSVLANRMGWQVARTVVKNTATYIRKMGHRQTLLPDAAEVLDRDGIVVIPNYLDLDRYEHLTKAFDEYGVSRHIRDHGQENGSGIRYASGPVLSEHEGDSADFINSTFAFDPIIISLAEHVIGRTVRPPLRVIYQSLELGDAEGDDSDREQMLHSDKHYPCAKAIYMLDEVTEGSSPFIYAVGSHRLTKERLHYEYAMAIREALLRKGDVTKLDSGDNFRFERSRNVMGDSLRRRLQIHERAMTCPANSLILTNNAGFHRRGKLQPGERRRSLWVNFYPYQRPWYGRLAFRSAKSVLDTDNVSRALPAVYVQSQDQARSE